MKTRLFVIAVLLFFAASKMSAQSRIIGARSFEMDDATRSRKTVRLDVASPLTSSYVLHLPNVPPASDVNFLAFDANGNGSWSDNSLPALAEGTIWCGNAQNIASPMTPGHE